MSFSVDYTIRSIIKSLGLFSLAGALCGSQIMREMCDNLDFQIEL